MESSSNDNRRVVVAVLAAMLVASAVLLAVPRPAEAYCGQGQTGVEFFAPASGTPKWGKEDASSHSTCDGDDIYVGYVYDILTDGSCVTVQYRDAGSVYTMATSCNSAGNQYTFTDQNGDSFSEFRLLNNYDWTSFYVNNSY